MIEDKIKSVYVGIAGNHIKSLNSHGAVGIKDKEVTSYDIDRVIDSAQAVSIPSDQNVLHVLPQEYIIDNQIVMFLNKNKTSPKKRLQSRNGPLLD